MGCGFSKSIARVSRTAGPPIPPVPGGDDRLPEQRISARTKSTRPAPQSAADIWLLVVEKVKVGEMENIERLWAYGTADKINEKSLVTVKDNY